MDRKIKEFKVQGIRDYEALDVWDALKVGALLKVKILDKDFYRTDNPQKKVSQSVAIILELDKNTPNKKDKIIGFVPDDEACEIYNYLLLDYNLYECKVLSKNDNNGVNSLTVRVDIKDKKA